jgi:Cu(I)/Ag(I) efflux system membrane protein CusA/SilA
VCQALADRGITSPLDTAGREDRVAQVAQGALERFDRLVRAIYMEKLEGQAAARARALISVLRREVVAFLLRKGALKEDLPDPRWQPLVDELAGQYAALLDEWILLEDVTRGAQAVADFLVKEGVLEARSDLWVKPGTPGSFLSGLASVVTGGAAATAFEDLRDSLEVERDRFMADQVERLDWALADRAPRALAQSVIDEAIAAARAARHLVREPDEGELLTLAGERSQPLEGNLLLWRKRKSDLVKELDADLQVPGWKNIWTQPIINRIDMLSTGVRTEIGLKVFGKRLEDLQAASRAIVEVLERIPGAVDVTASQTVGKNYLEISVDRERAARFGFNVEDVQEAIELALGGKHVTTTVEGRDRFPVSLSYARDFLEHEDSIRSILVSSRMHSMSAGESRAARRHRLLEPPREAAPPLADGHGGSPTAPQPAPPATPGGKAAFGTPLPGGVTTRAEPEARLLQVPLALVADVRSVAGPTMIQSEDGLLCSFVSLNVRGRDMVGFVDEARSAVADLARLPPGCHVQWSGQFEHQIRAQRTLTLVMPLILAIIFTILYLTYRDLPDTFLMFLAVPGAVAGGAIFQYLLPRLGVEVSGNFSVAVWVGYIACFGLATATSIVMMVYLREAIARRGGMEKIQTEEEIRAAVIEGAVHRLRPKLLTEATTVLALIPMLWATGVGAEYMRPMAAPILGGILVADEVIDVLIPVLFHWDRCRRLRRRQATQALERPAP